MSVRVVAVHVWPRDSELPLACDELVLDWGGPIGDRHHGLTMASDTRQSQVFERGTEIRNHRQVSIVDTAELAQIAEVLGVPQIEPGLIADNICLEGLPDLTSLPRMTRLIFSSGAVIMTGGENFPCAIAGAMVERVHGSKRSAFTRAAAGLRGITGWVERPGVVRPGDSVTVAQP